MMPDRRLIRLAGIARDETGVASPFTGEINIGSVAPPVPPDGSSELGLTYVRTLGLPPLYMAFAYGDMTGRIVDGNVHLLFTGDVTQPINSRVFEVRVTDASVCEFVREYPDTYHGKRGTWIQNASFAASASALEKEWLRRRDIRWYAAWQEWRGLAELHKGKSANGWTWVDFTTSASPALNGGHWYDPDTDLLYITYVDGYNVAGRPDWNCVAVRLFNDGTTECYGPWRFQMTDGDGVDRFGSRCGSFIRPDPRNGDILTTNVIGSGNISYSWGPNLVRIARGMFPVDSTPSGPDPNLDIVFPQRDLWYYFIGNDVDLTTGQTSKPIRSFRRRKDLYVFEHWLPEQVSPGTLNPYIDPEHYGFGTWTDLDFIGGLFPLTDKLIFFHTNHGSLSQNPSDPLAAHGFYANTVNGAICTHGFPAVPAGITGPCSTSRIPMASVYSWDRLDAVGRGEVVDWESEASLEENLESKFNIVTAPPESVGNSKIHAAGFFDERTRKYYTIAQGADRGYTNWGIYSAYIHEWDVAE